jgi:hypothetical protein
VQRLIIYGVVYYIGGIIYGVVYYIGGIIYGVVYYIGGIIYGVVYICMLTCFGLAAPPHTHTRLIAPAHHRQPI